MAYWILNSGSPDGASLALIGKQPELSLGFFTWFDGTKIPKELPSPLSFSLSKSSGSFIPDFFSPAIPLMSRKMLDALAQAGVSNIDTYDAKLHDAKGALIRSDFLAVNIIGAVPCANLDESVYEADDPSELDFELLVIDADKAEGHLLFRLYESVNAVVIHDSVKRVLEEHDLSGLDFMRPEDWSG